MAKLTERQFKAVKMGQREELADLISLVDAKDTPLTSMAKKGSQAQEHLFPLASGQTPLTQGFPCG